VSEDNDLIRLYSQRILALAAGIPHLGRLPAPGARVMKRSPLCGSTVTVDLTVKDGRVAEFAQDVKACALGQASAALFGGAVIGRTREEIATVQRELRAMLKYAGPVPLAPFDGYEALVPARDYKNRHASIQLVVEATAAAFDEIAAKSPA
jgi:NifU-like protein involved in Fe-S cluster formation